MSLRFINLSIMSFTFLNFSSIKLCIVYTEKRSFSKYLLRRIKHYKIIYKILDVYDIDRLKNYLVLLYGIIASLILYHNATYFPNVFSGLLYVYSFIFM